MRRAPVAVLSSWVAADLLAILGARLAALAMPWLILTSTGSAALAGLVAAAELAPMVVARTLCGPLVDRLGTVRAAVWADALCAVAAAGLPLLWTAHLLTVPTVLGLAVVVGAARGPGDAAKQAMLPELAAATGQRLERVAGIGATTERLASTVGFAAGGVAVALVGAADALAITAAGFTVSAGLGLLVLRRALAASRPVHTARERYLDAFCTGLSALRRDRVLRGIAIMLAITNGVDQAFTLVLLPAWIVRTGHGPEILGGLLATFMFAAVAGGVVATALAGRLPRRATYVAAFLIAGAPRFLILTVAAPVPAVLAVFAGSGFAAGFINPLLSVVTLEHAPPAVRARVVALIGAASIALTPLGGVAGGMLTDRAGVTTALLLAGALYLAVTLAPMRRGATAAHADGRGVIWP